MTSVEFVCPRPSDQLFDTVFRLGESQSKFVGMLTPSAWRDYAEKRTILAAVDGVRGADGNPMLLGYAAFRLPRNEIVLAHLVVHPDARKRNIARALVEELSRRYPERRGIAARCRRDFPAHNMWPHLNFIALGDRPGRSQQGHLLTYWWRDHGHPDLMTWQGAPASVVSVVADANVFLDLHSDAAGSVSANTRYVFNDVLGGRVELLVTPELHNEINRRGDASTRRQLQAALTTYPRLPAQPSEVERHCDALITALGRAPMRAQDVSDLRHIAYAAAAGVQVVVTRDNPALRKLRPVAAEVAGIPLVSPEELVTLVDEAEAAPAYWPAALLGTGYQVEEAGADDVSRLDCFFDTGTGEKKRDYVQRLRNLAQQRPRSHRLLYTDPSGNPVALLGTAPSDGVLEVTVFRMRPFALQGTLAAQLVSALRPAARAASVSAIRVTDPQPQPLLVEALLADGFRPGPRGPVAATITSLCDRREAANAVEEAVKPLTVEEQAVFTDLTVLAAAIRQDQGPTPIAALERQLRPLRIVDAPIDVWLVPIKPVYASALFGYPTELFQRADELGISVEHVYYRGGRSGEQAPARVLWYVSGAHHGFVIGCSELVEVADGAPDELYRRFRRLGVYTRADVIEAAGTRGTVRALRVVNTELFDAPLALTRLKRLADLNGQTLQLRSAARISTGLVADILREARGESRRPVP